MRGPILTVLFLLALTPILAACGPDQDAPPEPVSVMFAGEQTQGDFQTILDPDGKYLGTLSVTNISTLNLCAATGPVNVENGTYVLVEGDCRLEVILDDGQVAVSGQGCDSLCGMGMGFDGQFTRQ